MLRRFLPLLLVASAIVVGCGSPSGHEPAAENQGELASAAALSPTRGILLISLDTLRADHLGAYGYHRPTSPFIDSLAARGVLFDNAYVQLPGTLPSHMSIFTGLYPVEHGVYPPNGVLSPEIPTLPELFQAAGYRTGGHTEGGYMDGHFGFNRGFDEFSDAAQKNDTDVERTFARGLDFLRQLPAEAPFFLFLHTYSIHDPYFPPEAYASLYWEGEAPDTFRPTGPHLVDVNRGRRQVSERQVEYFKALYDASITYVDDVLRDFFAELESLGLSDEITVILTSDHGEEFLEHGRLVHEQIYPEHLRVPLIVVHPEVEDGRRVERIVESIDIAATLLDLQEIADAPTTSGESLLPLIAGQGETPGETSQAIAEGLLPKGHTMMRRNDDELRQLVVHWAAADDGSHWIEEKVSFDLAAGRTELRVASFQEPHTLRLAVTGADEQSFEIFPDRWTTIPIEISGEDRFNRVEMSVEECLPAPPPDPRCLGFRLEGRPLPSFELYDLAEDPAAQHNLARQKQDLVIDLMRYLLEYSERRPLRPASESVLDAELTEQLRALGYL